MTDSIEIKYNGQDYSFYYVRLGALLQYIQDNIMYYIKIDDTNGSPMLKFDTEVETNLMYVENLQISVDPTICVINKTLTIDNSEYKYIPDNQNAEPFESSLFSDLKGYGQIMNIYVNMRWILLKLNELKDKNNNKVVLIDFLNNTLSSISTALGGINALEANIDETTNTVVIRDKNPLPNVEGVVLPILNSKLSKNIPNKYVLFDLYGYKENGANSHASFIKDFNFTTEISPQLSSMLTIGATANSTVVGENSTAFSRFNYGLTDRYKKEITPSKTEFNKVYSDVENELELLIKNFGDTYKNYIEYIKRLSNEGKNTFNNGEGDTYKDALTNYLTYLQQVNALRDKQARIDLQSKGLTPPPPAFLPGTGFIPFNMSLTMDGLAGMKIYNKFYLDTEYLPTNYPENAEFLIKNISHKIENNKWFTTIESIVTTKGEYKDKNKNIIGGGNSGGKGGGGNKKQSTNPDEVCGKASTNNVNTIYPKSVKWGGTQPVIAPITKLPSVKINLSSQPEVKFVWTNVTYKEFINSVEELIEEMIPTAPKSTKKLISTSALAIGIKEQGRGDKIVGFNNNLTGVESSGFSVFNSSDVNGKVQATEGGTKKRKFYYSFSNLKSGLIPSVSKIIERNMFAQDGEANQWAWRWFRDWNGYGGRSSPNYKSDCDTVKRAENVYKTAANAVNTYSRYK